MSDDQQNLNETADRQPVEEGNGSEGTGPSAPVPASPADSEFENDESGRLSRLADTALATGKQAADAAVSGSRKAAAASASAAQAIGSGTARATIASGQAVADGARRVFDTTGAATAHVFSSAQALIASDLSSTVNEVVAAAVKGVPTLVDKAMDARFIETGVGGSYHRLFDGGHTIFGAFKAAHSASPDDTLIQETLGAIQGLLRDVSTPRGLPLATWNKETFDAVAASLDSTFGIPKSWLYDLSSYDVGDLLGGTVGAVSMIFGWNRADTETFSQIAASMAFSAALSTNPVLMPIAVVALGRAFHKAQSADDYGDLADGVFKGALVSGTSLGAIALVGVAGGPAGVAMLTGITAGVLAQSAAKNVELDAVCRFVTNEARTVMSHITAQAVTIGDGTANFAARAGSAVTQAATATSDVVGKQASQAGRAAAAATAAASKFVTDSASTAGRFSADQAVAAGRATADAARAAGRAGAAATAAASSAVESVARRAKALVDRNDPEDPAVDRPDTSDN